MSDISTVTNKASPPKEELIEVLKQGANFLRTWRVWCNGKGVNQAENQQ